jgi:AAA domain, putative AbiEii toxin, Type IV TA system
MRIEVVRWYAQAKGATYPRLVLEQGRTWQDWSTPQRPPESATYRTLFDAYYEQAQGKTKPEPLGSVKILKRGRPTPDLPSELSALPEDCCSLGQTIDYYAAVEKLGEPVAREVLAALRDVTADERIAQAFRDEPGFQASLLRFSEAARIFHYRSRPLHLSPPEPEPFEFTFRTKLRGFDDPHEIAFAFDPKPAKLGRLFAIVGKNGTGKTRYLARLSWALWGLRQEGDEIVPARPPVGRVIAVSYSALDVFERPIERDRALEDRPAFDNYQYCGYRSRTGVSRPSRLFARLGEDLAAIEALGRRDLWDEMLQETRLLEEERAWKQRDDGALVKAARRLGAGAKTALSVLTRLLASLRNGAFVLFDEPELNMHPTLLASLLRVVHAWLERFDAHGVVATHSPMVLQEIPGKMVRVLDRTGKVPLVRPYAGECFGQSLSEIVTEVFGQQERDKNYATALRSLVKEEGLTVEEVKEAFGRPLSLNAAMALQHLARGGRRDA